MWNGKPYHFLDYELKETFGKKTHKLALDGGMTCPNRDGTLGTDGCISCSHGGSGDFAAPLGGPGGVWEQIKQAKGRVAPKAGEYGGCIIYLQFYTNAYQVSEYLNKLFGQAISHPDVVGLFVGTRPDCLPPEALEVLERLNRKKPVWMELGLQTIHDETVKVIGRGYETSCSYNALRRLKEAGLITVVHVTLGSPGEGRKEIYQTVDALGKLPVDGIKLQLLHVLRGARLAEMHEENPFPIFTPGEYVDMVIGYMALLPAETVIYRTSGDGPESLLIAPEWSGNKCLLLDIMTRRFEER